MIHKFFSIFYMKAAKLHVVRMHYQGYLVPKITILLFSVINHLLKGFADVNMFFTAMLNMNIDIK